MMCEHLTHPEHWQGDAGDVAQSLAPFALFAVAARTALNSLGCILGIMPGFGDTADLTFIHPAARPVR